jgi:Domain of unknown function (DUF1992)
MTSRKPPNVSVQSWVEHQIRAAQAAGRFDNLPGAGQPIANLDGPRDELAWVADYLRREEVDVAALLPPALALAKEVEDLPKRLLAEKSATRVRAIVGDLNDRIRRAHRLPQAGPPVRVWVVDVEQAVEQWTIARAARDAAASSSIVANVGPAVVLPRRRRWFGRGTR